MSVPTVTGSASGADPVTPAAGGAGSSPVHGPIVTLGESMALVRSAEPGTFAQVHELRLGIGGAEANVAIGLSRLGTPAVWLGRVGDDSLGRRIERELHAERVAVHAVVDPGAPTGLMLKESPTPGSTVVHYYRAGSAGSRLGPGDLDALGPVGIARAALLHVTGITPALSASARAAVDAAVDRAVAAGVPVSFDVNHRSRLWADSSYVEVYRSLAARATIVFAGDDEAALLVGGGTSSSAAAPSSSGAVSGSTPPLTDARALAEAIASLGPSTVVIKRGALGAAALDQGSWLEVAPVPITPVDTVGAGDAFVAGWLAEWHAGLGPDARLATAAKAGAFACLHPGDWEGLPTRRDLAGLGAGGDPVRR